MKPESHEKYYIHFENDTDIWVKVKVKHNFLKITYYETKLAPDGGTGTPYKPEFQSYNYTLDFYNNKSGDFLATYQYVDVEHGSKKARLYTKGGHYNVEVTDYGTDSSAY